MIDSCVKWRFCAEIRRITGPEWRTRSRLPELTRASLWGWLGDRLICLSHLEFSEVMAQQPEKPKGEAELHRSWSGSAGRGTQDFRLRAYRDIAPNLSTQPRLHLGERPATTGILMSRRERP